MGNRQKSGRNRLSAFIPILLIVWAGLPGWQAKGADDPAWTRSLAICADDFDEDGVPDLVASFAGTGGGGLLLHRGNVDAIYPNTIEARERQAAGTFTDAPFFAPVLLTNTREAPDMLVAGDFDNDGHRDVAFAARAGSTLYLCRGTGRGDLRPARPISLPGTIRSLAVGEYGRADGLAEVFADVDGLGSFVFEGNQGALRSLPRPVETPEARAVTSSTHTLRMRLNGDGIDDLVVLDPDARTPSIVLSRPEQTFMVTNTADAGSGSLRAAIEAANNSTGDDSIAFSIVGSGPHTIALASPLPTISPDGGAVTIDATTQPGYQNRPVVTLNGSRLAAGANGIVFIAANCVVRGLAINGFLGSSQSGGGYGVFIFVGGSCLVEGNHLGTDTTGTEAIPNTTGVDIQISANSIIGGTAAAARNVISGNESAGVLISYDETATANRILGNYIGTNAAGTEALGNGGGVYISSGAGNIVGGTTASTRNVIAGSVNFGFGVGIAYEEATDNVVQGNYIGVAADGVTSLGNAGTGAFASSGASNNIFGGPATGAANLIAYNQEGVQISFESTATAPTVNNLVSRNSIFGNGGLGINLSFDYDRDSAPNDPSDADTGPNNFQNYPEITSVSNGRVRGVLNSRPNTRYTIEFFANDECDQPSGFGEGKTYLGEASVLTNAGGQATFDADVQAPAGLSVTATATDDANNTSEFSQCFAVGGSAEADLIAGIYSNASAVAAGRAFNYYVTVTNNGPGTARGITMTDPLPQQTTFVAITQVAGWTINTPSPGAGGSVVATAASLNAGASATFVITARVRDNATSGDLINTASVTSTMDPVAANNSSTDITTLNGADAAADLAVSIDADPNPAVLGGQIIYSIRVTNAGPSDATDAVLTAEAPQGTVYSFAVPDPTSAPPVGEPGEITWDLNSFPSGRVATFFIIVSLPFGTTVPPEVMISADVTNSTRDPNTNNNSASTTSQVQSGQGAADLALTASANDTSARAGDSLTYTVRVTNNGPDAASNVVLFDELPHGAYFVSATLTQGSLTTPAVFDSGAAVGMIGTLASGASATLTVTVTVTAGGGTLRTDPFTLGSIADPNMANNRATVSTAVESAGMAAISWEAPDLESPDLEPPPRNLQAVPVSSATPLAQPGRIVPPAAAPALRTAGARRADPPICYNVYTSNVPNVSPSQANFYGSVPPSQTSTTAPVAPGGSFFIVTACYPTGESAPTNEDGTGQIAGPTVSSVVVTSKKITVKGTGFAAPMQVFIDGIPFANTPKVKSTKVNQKGSLLTGQSLAQYARAGQTVLVIVRNASGGTTIVPVTRR